MFEIQEAGGRILVRGRWDASQTNKASVLLDTVQESVEVDLSELEYISSAGIGVLVKAQLRLQESGKKLTLIHLQQRVRLVFNLASLEDFFDLH